MSSGISCLERFAAVTWCKNPFGFCFISCNCLLVVFMIFDTKHGAKKPLEYPKFEWGEETWPEQRYETLKTVTRKTTKEIIIALITNQTLSIVGKQRKKTSNPKDSTKEFCRQVKCSACLDCCKTLEETPLLLEKAAHTWHPKALPDPQRINWWESCNVKGCQRLRKIISCLKEYCPDLWPVFTPPPCRNYSLWCI